MKRLIVAIIAALIIVPAATAAKPAGSSISLDQSAPAFGDTVTFTVSSPVADKFVNLNCYQGGVLVANGWAAYFPGGTGQAFGLYSPVWKSGAADCTADLGMLTSNGKWKVLASTSFHVSA